MAEPKRIVLVGCEKIATALAMRRFTKFLEAAGKRSDFKVNSLTLPPGRRQIPFLHNPWVIQADHVIALTEELAGELEGLVLDRQLNPMVHDAGEMKSAAGGSSWHEHFLKKIALQTG